MIDSTPTASGAVVDECPARPSQPVVEADAGGQAEEAREDALAQARQGACSVALEREQVLAGPEDALDALADGREVRAAAALLRADFGIDADVWSLTSINELRRDGLDAERWNLLHPLETPHVSFVGQQLEKAKGPVVALLLAGPALSLPNMLVLGKVMGVKKTAAFCGLIVVMATIAGKMAGQFL